MFDSDTPLLIRLHTPKGKFLKGTADVEVLHRTRGDRFVYREVKAGREIPIGDLRRGPLEEYLITVTPGKADVFAPQQQTVTIPHTGTVTLTFVFEAGARVRAAREAVDSPPYLSPPFIPTEDDEPLPDRYFVAGTVAGPGGAGVGGLRVVLADRNAIGDVTIKTLLTNNAGRFSAEFDAAAIRQRGKSKPDLQARVYSGSTFLAASAVRYNAGERETLDVLIPDAGAAALPSEYETLVGAIRPHFAHPLHRLEETPERQDITYLANKTGWDARAVALAALADSAGRAHSGPHGTPSIDPAFYYALFRAGLPADAEALYKTDVQVVGSVLRKSLETNIIPKRLESSLPQVLEAYTRIGAEVRLAGAPPIGVSPLRDMLDVARLAPAEQETFARLLVQHGDRADRLWTSVRHELGDETARRLEVDGKLASITLNNAPLMRAVHAVDGPDGVRDPARLAELGFHRPGAWQDLVQEAAAVPAEIPGTTDAEKRGNYARYLAAQVRISYPTASVAEMLRPAVPEAAAFLSEHHRDFVIGAQPVEQYIRRNALTVDPAVVEDVKRAQRLYQLTPSDRAFTGLAGTGEIHSAFDIVRQPRDVFVTRYADAIGGVEEAGVTYERAGEIYNYVLNLATGFALANNGFELGAGNVLNPAPAPPTGANANDLIAYPTLEKLFGSMDYCACDHCRSVLSPAAYLVDLLQFIDHVPVDGTTNPQEVLFRRRPDIQHLPLTCENTNVAMPYIDIVNETLEYFIANQMQALSLRDYLGHDTDGARSEDLLASPQFVMDDAYTTLQNAPFPPPLPFHRPLELLRATMDALGVPLPLAMERLRKSDVFSAPYAWLDILTEELRISRPEHLILTDSAAVPLAMLYGFAAGTSDANVIAAISSAKTFARRTGVTYEELVELLHMRFVNPASDLLPRLGKLRMPIQLVTELTTIADVASVARFDAALPSGGGTLDPVDFDGSIHQWATDQQNFNRLMTLIVLSAPKPTDDVCNFDLLELRRAKPAANEHDTSNRLDATAYFRFMRFIRLWRKTGWTMAQVDAALCALSNVDGRQLNDADIDTAAEVDARLKTFLPRLAVVQRVMKALDLTPERDLLPLLACWSDIGTFGESSLYQQLFLNPAILGQDPVFAANVNGDYLTGNKLLSAHAAVVRAALNLTGAQYDEIVTLLGLGGNTPLTLANVSLIFRHGYLSRKLRMSVRELRALIDATGLDPFTQPDFAGSPLQPPAILRLIDFVQAIRASGLDIADALYLIWNKDLSGKSAPPRAATIELARTLRADFAEIESQFAAGEDPGGNLARARLAMVYGEPIATTFFALLENTIEIDVPYPAPSLDATIIAADPLLAHDAFRLRLARTGLLTAAQATGLKNLPAATPAFQAAIDALFLRGEEIKTAFFTLHAELLTLYNDYVISQAAIEVKRSALLAAFRPTLTARRKRQQALQRVSASAKTSLPFARALLDKEPPPYPLHAWLDASRPAMETLLSAENGGLELDVYFAPQIPAATLPDLIVTTAPRIEYSLANPLPNAATAPISAVWHGELEAPEDGFYNFIIEADAPASVFLTIGVPRTLVALDTTRRNSVAIELEGGVLYEFELRVENVKDVLSVQWETAKRPREVLPLRYLWSPETTSQFLAIYERFLKVSALAGALKLTTNEVVHTGTAADQQIAGTGWLNDIPVGGDTSAVNISLGGAFRRLLELVRIKKEVAARDEQVLRALQNPAQAAAIMHWDAASLATLLAHFGLAAADLGGMDAFGRVHDAFAVARTVGVSPAALIAGITNEPTADTVRAFHGALRARHDAEDWRTVVKPINDRMRGMQRDALVAYVLHYFRGDPATQHIDTTERLFEYFLMDVAMEPCMQTSRIRHALSSVQLFIERCLMSLETQVSPASLDKERWEWMKRYRMWEANRKVFLFPENWLEPELRDDKSPIFEEIESELLQSDITEDSAATAVLNYMARLEETSKLEPCGICHTPDVDHIIARTSGANRKYFYRRRERRAWTPWEEIKTDIEDNPVLPVVWNGRLLLFWLRVSQGTTSTATNLPPSGGKVSDIAEASVPSQGIVTKIVLCWSEYYNGKWQAAKTSDPDRPMQIATSSNRPGAQSTTSIIDRTQLRMRAFNTEGTPLRVGIFYEHNFGFVLYNTHTVGDQEPVPYVSQEGKRYVYTNASTSLATAGRDGQTTLDLALTALYEGATKEARVFRKLLDPIVPLWPVQPFQPMAAREDPFLAHNSQHAFYVTAQEKLVPLWDQLSYGAMQTARLADSIEIPPVVDKPQELRIAAPPSSAGLGIDVAVADPEAISRFVTEDAYIRHGLGTSVPVTFGGIPIGPSGSIPDRESDQ